MMAGWELGSEMESAGGSTESDSVEVAAAWTDNVPNHIDMTTSITRVMGFMMASTMNGFSHQVHTVRRIEFPKGSMSVEVARKEGRWVKRLAAWFPRRASVHSMSKNLANTHVTKQQGEARICEKWALGQMATRAVPPSFPRAFSASLRRRQFP